MRPSAPSRACRRGRASRRAWAGGGGAAGEPVRVGARPELTGRDHGREPGPDAGLPAVEPISEDRPDVVVALAELAEQAGDRATPLPAPLPLDSYQGVGPVHQAGP